MLELFRSPRRATVWFIETSLLSLMGVCAVAATLGWARAFGEAQVLRGLLVCGVVQGSLYYHGLYNPPRATGTGLVMGYARALGIAGLLLWILFHRIFPSDLRKGVLSVMLGGAAIVLPASRAIFETVSTRGAFLSPTLVLGGGPLAERCAALIAGDSALGLRLAGVLLAEGESPRTALPVVGSYRDLVRLAEDLAIRHILVASSDNRGTLPMATLVDLKFRGIQVERGVDFYERATAKVFVPTLRPSDVVFEPRFILPRSQQVAKRLFDIVVSSMGIVLGLPLMLVTAIAIKLDSNGPILYSQLRTGHLGVPFLILKFRSMRTDAEASGATWAQTDDPRVTRVGRIIRRTRIDELPQLFNVLTGEMSLVGPRPERPIFVEQLEQAIPFFRQRLSVKPGVTGHAQVRARYGASLEDALEKLEYDLFYIKRCSLWFDLSILVDTVKVVLLRIGSR